jgi:hypothetical protein
MAVNVDEIVSSVIPEPEEQGGSSEGGGGESWKKVAQFRAFHALNIWDRTRTSAEGFDD